MQSRVQRWGNSLAIRIPRSLAQKGGFAEGTPVELRVEDNAIVIRPRRYTLEELLSRVTPQNLPEATETGPPIGREIW